MKKNRVEENIDMLDNLERKLIELRYFKKLRWYEVARGVEYSERHCRRMDNAILNKFSANFRSRPFMSVFLC